MSSDSKTTQAQMPEQEQAPNPIASESDLSQATDVQTPIHAAHLALQAREDESAPVHQTAEELGEVPINYESDAIDFDSVDDLDEIDDVEEPDVVDDLDGAGELDEIDELNDIDDLDDIDDFDGAGELDEIDELNDIDDLDDIDNIDDIAEVHAIVAAAGYTSETSTEADVSSKMASEPKQTARPTPTPHPAAAQTAPAGVRTAPIPASAAVNAPGRNEMSVENRAGSDTTNGSNDRLAWGARSDVGLVRGHNEDAFLVKAPLFAVCDGMGGHAAGEVASGIAVRTIANNAPAHADEILLGAAVEAANAAVLAGAEDGTGKPGMGCTATCIYIENNLMSVAHVGDSRVYLLHGGTLVRITHDHSYVEELVDAGEITADEARVHPSRSIITRALGSDPDMYADHFTLEVSSGDRVILCSDGLSSMVSDKDIEELAVSSVTPQAAADTLVSAALTAGGHDNVTVVVVDVEEDGVASIRRRQRIHGIQAWFVVVVLAILAMVGVVYGLVRNSWYVGNNDGTVGIYRGISDEFLGVPLGQLVETSSVQVSDLPEAVQHQLNDGIGVANESEARRTVERYRDQIDSDKTHAAQVAQATQNAANVQQQVPPAEEAPAEAEAEAEPGEEQVDVVEEGTNG